MKEKEAIKKVYDEIHASDALFGKVMELNMKSCKAKAVVKYVAASIAAATLAFGASNGICYAATGESLVSKVIVLINGEETEQEMVWTSEGDKVYGEVTIEVEDGDSASISFTEEAK